LVVYTGCKRKINNTNEAHNIRRHNYYIIKTTCMCEIYRKQYKKNYVEHREDFLNLVGNSI